MRQSHARARARVRVSRGHADRSCPSQPHEVEDIGEVVRIQVAAQTSEQTDKYTSALTLKSCSYQ